MVNMADSELMSLPSYQVPDKLGEMLRSGLYFRQLYLFNEMGNPITGYPERRVDEIFLSPEENAGVQLALRGVLVQTYTIPPWPGENTAQVSFIVAIQNDSEQVEGVLLGRTDLNSNPFTQPAIQALESLNAIGGVGIIMDENQNILYHSSSIDVMSQYLGNLPTGETIHRRYFRVWYTPVWLLSTRHWPAMGCFINSPCRTDAKYRADDFFTPSGNIDSAFGFNFFGIEGDAQESHFISGEPG